jgi:hypothetical protein
MILTLDQAERLTSILRTTRPYVDLPVTNRAMTDLWSAMDDCLLKLRMPLYYRRFRKRPPKPADYHTAIQAGLALVGAFATGMGTNQAIISSRRGWIDRISFQPRPHGMAWSAKHAISPQDLVHAAHTTGPYEVSLEDFLHLSAKVVYAVAHHNAGEIPDATATYAFGRTEDAILVDLVVREHGGSTYRDSLLS